MIALFWMLACQPAEMLDPLEQPEVKVEVRVAEKQVEAAEALQLEVLLSTKEGWRPEAFDLDVEGLDVERLEAEVLETEAGEQEIHRFALTGPAGGYVLEPMEFRFTQEGGASKARESVRLFFDIGPAALQSELQGLLGLPPEKESPWPRRLLWISVGMVLFLLALLVWLRRPKKEAPLPPVIPPDEEALAAWEIICADTGLDDHTRALALSQIFRRYLERVFFLPTTAFTSSEVMAAIGTRLSERHLGQSKRLLSATDRIKYARRGGGRALFESLDTDLREIIAATRPAPAEELSDA